MPVELFGFSLGRTNKRNNVDLSTPPQAQDAKVPSFVIPDLDDAYTVDAGGVFGYACGSTRKTPAKGSPRIASSVTIGPLA